VSIFFLDENWRRDLKKRERAKNCTIYTDISYYGKLKELTEVTEYRYPPNDRGKETSKTRVTLKEKKVRKIK